MQVVSRSVSYTHLDVYKRQIVSDVMMPEMDGIEMCRHIKTNLTYSHIPIILLTAKTNLESKTEGMENGAEVYICLLYTSRCV